MSRLTRGILGAIISTLYFMTLFVPIKFWFYHWTLRLLGLVGFFLLGTITGEEKPRHVPWLEWGAIGGYYTTIFSTELTMGYVPFLHLDAPQTVKNYVMFTPIAVVILFSWFFAFSLGIYYGKRWNLE